MGWLFGWNTRKELADHLISGNGVHTIKHCFKGNNLWAVQEYTHNDVDWEGKPNPKAGQTVRFIALYLIRGRDRCNPRTGRYDPDGWGYKDMDESAGPYYFNCPLSYLDMVPDPGGYATEWRAKVREHWAKRNQKLTYDQRIMLCGREYKVGDKHPRGGYYIWDYTIPYWLPKRMMNKVEVLK